MALAAHADHTPAWLAFFGALAVALLAAVTADIRQRKALDAEGKRHLETLEGNAARQADELAHSRELADLAEMRLLLDVLAERTATLIDRFAATGIALRTLHNTAPGSPEEMDAMSEMHTPREAAYLATNDLRVLVLRLGLRLGRGHALLVEVTAFANKTAAALEDYPTVRVEDDVDAIVNRQAKALADPIAKLNDAMFALGRSRLPT